MKILIVEDDPLLQQGLSMALSQESYVCECATLGKEADALITSAQYSAVLLDLGLPDIDGTTLLKQWRRQQISAPVLIMTARDALESRIEGLDAGADDYIIKPFELTELSARLRAIIRRHLGQSDNILTVDEFTLDLAYRQLKRKDSIIELTPREFAIISRLMLRAGKTVSREILQQDLYSWQDNFGSNTLEVYVHHLRQKLGKDIIYTVRGLGYRFGEAG
jgi:two-component system response regulator BasR